MVPPLFSIASPLHPLECGQAHAWYNRVVALLDSNTGKGGTHFMAHFVSLSTTTYPSRYAEMFIVILSTACIEVIKGHPIDDHIPEYGLPPREKKFASRSKRQVSLN
ncbi:hypothetical protein NLI96_g3097 [Meripilus lineatus]|uniref:Uncharacterized protein n=1 Tax=Meripilus lineatus TaxID=2056292 RepID=A0AAD5V7F2_9APHY|nr:hypothetical protein NLI96_g3097 [Physisporinus lineatus]